ncbi:MAG: uroporphyrinogen decarboxylase family protein [Bacteroidales bacterium]|nr:uroporphyrinogen decarboxylase family protein [Bacteroidales bacterium]
MKRQAMTPKERVSLTLSHQEPDRVPLMLSLTMHGARELGLSIQEYFSKAEHVVEGQLRMQQKYGHDFLNPFFYSALEVEAFGAEVIYSEDGPPNSGRPLLNDISDIGKLHPVDVRKSGVLYKMLRAIELLKEKTKGAIPIMGSVTSPFSLPVMQLGFDKYFELIHFNRKCFDQLMGINESFCVDWANAQLSAGADAIGYADPVSSPTIIPRELYAETGFQIARRCISKIRGNVATNFASGKCLPIAGMIMQTGTMAVVVSAQEDLAELKKTFGKKLALVGNLNGLEMRRWNTETTFHSVKEAILKAAPGGGYILSDNHGEIPFQVPEAVLMDVAAAVKRYGQYPITNQ